MSNDLEDLLSRSLASLDAAADLRALDDVATAGEPLAGVVVHEFLDAWWKFGYEDSFTQDPDDVEEWFGLVRLAGS